MTDHRIFRGRGGAVTGGSYGRSINNALFALSIFGLAACSGEQTSSLPEPIRQVANAAGAPRDAHGERIEGGRYVVRFAEAGENVALVFADDGSIVQRQETLAYRPRTPAQDAFLSAPASVVEDFVDAVLRGEAGAYRARGQALVDGVAVVRSRMDPVRFAQAETHAATVMVALQRNDAKRAALEALESYRVFEETTAVETRAAPIEVSLLDYSGFRIAALALPGRTDWVEADAAVSFSARQWQTLRAQVTDSAVVDLMNELQRTLSAAAQRRDAQALGAAARAQLAAVDLVERYFDRAYKTGAGATEPIDQD